MRTNVNKIFIGISSCLVGHKVRYDGGHQYHAGTVETLIGEFELIPFCPEVEIGLVVPRPKIQLVDVAGKITCVDGATKRIDYTQKLLQCCDQQMDWLKRISGYVLKTKSPSCGLSKVKTDYQGEIKPIGRGIFASRLAELFPELPLIEEDQFEDSKFTAKFLKAVKCYSQTFNLD